MYVIAEIGGKQFKLREKDKIFVPLMKAGIDETVTFDKILLVSNDGDVKVGAPVVEGATVTARVLQHVKADKVLVFKKKRRKGYRVKKGHRQRYTQVQIDSVSLA
jgi:large subunit ribosomal protein L21